MTTPDSQETGLRIEPTRCNCHPETCSHWPYRLMVGDLQLTTGEKDECDRLLGALLVWNTRPREDAGVVDAQDAARYRWLRDNCFINRASGRDFPHVVMEVCVGPFQGGIGWMHPGHTAGVGIPSLDKAVDTAMKAALAAALGKSNG